MKRSVALTPWTLGERKGEIAQQTALFCWAAKAQRAGFAAAWDPASYSEGAVLDTAKAVPLLKYLHAVPNGGKRSKATAAMLRASGVKRGVLDISWPVPIGGFHGLYIEMKDGVRGKLSAEQVDWKEHLTLHSYYVAVETSWGGAAVTIQEYLEGAYRPR